MKACAAPIPFEALVRYWAGDLDARENDDLEAHLFSCAACTAASARVAAVTETLRSTEPAVISGARLAELRAKGLLIEDNFVAAFARSKVTFGPQDLVIHHLGGLELDDTDRVHVTVRVDETDDLLVEVPRAPFDAAAGEVLVACQRHFAAFPPNVRFEVTTYRGEVPKKTTRYVVEHAFV